MPTAEHSDLAARAHLPISASHPPSVPVPVPVPPSVPASRKRCRARKVYSCGYNNQGQCGIGEIDGTVPDVVSSLTKVNSTKRPIGRTTAVAIFCRHGFFAVGLFERQNGVSTENIATPCAARWPASNHHPMSHPRLLSGSRASGPRVASSWPTPATAASTSCSSRKTEGCTRAAATTRESRPD